MSFVNKTVTFSSGDFNRSKPNSFSEDSFKKKYRFASKTIPIRLDNATYGYTKINITFNNSNIDKSVVLFYDEPNNEIGVRKVGTESFSPSKKGTLENYFYLNNNVVNGFEIIINSGEVPSHTLFLELSFAIKRNKIPSNLEVTISYDCHTPLYEYTMGLHTYSDYDSVVNPKLTTKLYSFTEINNWGIDTVVYNDKNMVNLALPYYYSFNNVVYKIGGIFKRHFGTKRTYIVIDKIIGKKVSEKSFGPKDWRDLTLDVSPSCIEPFMSDLGLIKEIIVNPTQPSRYKYYVGFDSTSKDAANNKSFGEYLLDLKTDVNHSPITGYMHLTVRGLPGSMTGTRTRLKVNVERIAILVAIALFSAAFGPAIVGAIKTGIGKAVSGKNFIKQLFDWLTGPNNPFYVTVNSEALASVLGYVGSALGLGSVLYALRDALSGIFDWIKGIFKISKVEINEPCLDFIHVYGNSPYIENGDRIDDDPEGSVSINGWFSDGVYFYRQQNNIITQKELSYAFVGFTKKTFSLQADNPTLVEDYGKLMLLPYLSGLPIVSCPGTTYESEERVGVVNIPNDKCCELKDCSPIQVRLPAGTAVSCISQADANNKTNETWDFLLEWTSYQIENGLSIAIDNLGQENLTFTHEIKVENKPNLNTFFFDNTDGLGLTLNKVLYYDITGCVRVLNGFYSIQTSQYYRLFYELNNGVIVNIWVLENSNSIFAYLLNNVTTIKSRVLTNLDYTSDWYAFNDEIEELYVFIRNNTDISINPNTLLSENYIKKGFINDLETLNTFFIFTNNTNSTTFEEAEEGWYLPLTGWFDYNEFYYERELTITLDVEQVCPTGDDTLPFGINIKSNEDGQPTPPYEDLTATINVFLNNSNSPTYNFNISLSGELSEQYIPFPNNINLGDFITNVTLTNISTPNPGKTTYEFGNFIECFSESSCEFGDAIITESGNIEPIFDNQIWTFKGYETNLFFNGVTTYTSNDLVNNNTNINYNFKLVNNKINNIRFDFDDTYQCWRIPDAITTVNSNKTGQYFNAIIPINISGGEKLGFKVTGRNAPVLNRVRTELRILNYKTISDINEFFLVMSTNSTYIVNGNLCGSYDNISVTTNLEIINDYVILDFPVPSNDMKLRLDGWVSYDRAIRDNFIELEIIRLL